MWEPDREQLAWAAGVFDGEGSSSADLRILPGRRQRRIVAQVAQAHEELPRRFQAAVQVGTVKGPYKPRRPNGLPVWSWSVSRFETVQAVAVMLWPWLGTVKREQFALALSKWQDLPNEHLACVHGSTYRYCTECRRVAMAKRPARDRGYSRTAERVDIIGPAFDAGESRREIAARLELPYSSVCVAVRLYLAGSGKEG